MCVGSALTEEANTASGKEKIMAFSAKNFKSKNNTSDTTPKKPKVTPGTYNSTITRAEWDSEYIDGTAFRVEYTLTDSDGKEYVYSEIFFNTERNRRTAEFLDYMESNGITADDFGNLIGVKEQLVIKKAPRQGRSLLTIVEREFVENGC